MRFVLMVLALTALISTSVIAQSSSSGDPPLSVPDARNLLTDRNPQARLRAALVLTAHRDAQGIEALIQLLEELPASDRRDAEQALRDLAGEWSPNPPLPGEDELSRKIRREVWAGWWRTVDGPALLSAIRKQTLSKEEAAAAKLHLEQLGDSSPAVCEKASTALKELGPKVEGLLQSAKGRDTEHQHAIDLCLREVSQLTGRARLPLSAPGLLAARKPDGASAALLAYLSDANDRRMKDEIVKALKILLVSEKADPAVVQALGDPLPLRRIVAAQALLTSGGAKHWPAVRPLLKDTNSEVRLRVAMALVNSQDKEAVPALIALLAELPRTQVIEAEGLLQRLAGSAAPVVAMGKDDAAARKKLADAWQVWWKEKGAAVDLAELAKTPASSGLTLIALGDGQKAGFGAPAGTGKVIAIDRAGKVRWEIGNLDHPMDVQLLPGERVLIAEYSGKRVTERDRTGKILWEVNLPGSPVNVQRLASGNTFIALYGTLAKANNAQPLLEVDPTGKMVASFSVPAGAPGAGAVPAILRDAIFAAQKFADGKMVCLTFDQICVWMDATGKEIHRAAMPQTKGSTPLNTVGNIDVTSKGNVLFAHSGGTVAEYDPSGKVVWQTNTSGHRATRLANGNTLVALVNGGVIEVDTTGRTVWQYTPPAGLQAIRARQ